MNPIGDISEWVQKAEGDYQTATTMVRKRKQRSPDNVCFCAEQCIEKYLKAFLVQHRIPFPKTHLLESLLDLIIQVEPSLEHLRSALAVLQPYAVEVRYPGFSATVEESQEAVKIMKRVRAVLRQQFGLSNPGSYPNLNP